jgi:hypothetical protein
MVYLTLKWRRLKWRRLGYVPHLAAWRLNQTRGGAMLGAHHHGRRWNLHPEFAATCKPRQ